MICSAANAARWVRAVGFGMSVLLAIKTLNEFAAFMWLFNFDFCVKNMCYVETSLLISAGSRSTKNIGRASLVIL